MAMLPPAKSPAPASAIRLASRPAASLRAADLHPPALRGPSRDQTRARTRGWIAAWSLLASLATPAVLAQSGPIGQPRTQPTQAYGASGASQIDNRGGYRPPTGNWSQGRSFSSPMDSGSAPAGGAREYGRANEALPAPTTQGYQPPRGARGNPTAANDRRVSQPRSEPSLVATRPVAAAETDSIQHLQHLVQQATMHETGLGAPRNLTRAFDLYCEAAAQGFPEALVRMAWMYADGNGVEKSKAAAYTLFMRAKRFGYAQGGELAQRFAGEPEVLPVCLRGTVVERGNVERPPTREELLAFSGRASSSMRSTAVSLSGERSRFAQIVLGESRRFKLDPRLVMAVMAAESGFDPNARSLKNAHGLMQLLPETAERFNVADINDPAENIRGGMAYLRWLLAYFRGDVALALAGYNAGEGAVEKHGGVPPYPETLAYVQRIRAIYPFDRHPYDPTATTAASKATTAVASPAVNGPEVALGSPGLAAQN